MKDFSAAGEFRAAKVGEHHNDQRVRRDTTRWFDMEAGTPAQKMITDPLEDLRQHCNRHLMLGLVSLEGHYSIYEKGDFYRRHLDAFRGDDARVLSVVLYLNEEAVIGQGGQLLLHTAAPTQIEATGGTLVVFLSREIEHEVLESQRRRLSFAGWFRQQKLVA